MEKSHNTVGTQLIPPKEKVKSQIKFKDESVVHVDICRLTAPPLLGFEGREFAKSSNISQSGLIHSLCIFSLL